MGEVIDSKINEAEAIVLNDLASKKLGNNAKVADEIPSAIKEQIKSATLQIDGKGNVK